jgi:RHS repeat-associated protein
VVLPLRQQTHQRRALYGRPAGRPGTRFIGQRWDSSTGLYWYRSRWYDPALGRFLQPDTGDRAGRFLEPGNPQALHRYSYVNNRPTVLGHSQNPFL